MHDQLSTLPSTPSPARLPLARTLLAALLLGVAATLGLASVTRAADPSQGLLDAVQETAGTTTEALAEAAAPVVDTAAPVLEATIEGAEPAIEALEPVAPVIEPIVDQLEPAVDAHPPVLEAGPLSDALDPVLDAVAPVVDATEPLAPIIRIIDERVSGPLMPAPLVPDLTVPALPVLEAGASDTVEASSDTVAARPTLAGDPGAVRTVAPPIAPAAFLPHPAGSVDMWAHRAGSSATIAGAADAGAVAVAGSSIGAAILLALLLYRPPSWRAWLPDALGPPFSRTLTVLVPPG